jgi:hypothetical protein
MMRRLAFVLLLLAAFAAGHLTQPQPSCPTEDSCRADYYAGAWHVIEVQP